MLNLVIARRISGYRSTSNPRHWYERLPVEVCTRVDVAVFRPFCLGLIQMRVVPLLYRDLVERWQDTIDSFHFSSIGERTLTPYDFSILIGLRVKVGSLISFDPDMPPWKAAQR
ncbi:hypothetical protein ACSBR1_009197 [Camellia fascicularis]